MADAPLPAVVERAVPVRTPAMRSALAVPAIIASAGDHAARRFLEFFAASIRNKNTRMAYYRAACSFFAWIERHHIGELADIEPLHVAAYIEALQATASKPTVKQHLAGHRQLEIRISIESALGWSCSSIRIDYAAMTTPVMSVQVAKARVRPDRMFTAVSWARRRRERIDT